MKVQSRREKAGSENTQAEANDPKGTEVRRPTAPIRAIGVGVGRLENESHGRLGGGSDLLKSKFQQEHQRLTELYDAMPTSLPTNRLRILTINRERLRTHKRTS